MEYHKDQVNELLILKLSKFLKIQKLIANYYLSK